MRKMTWEMNTGTPPWASFEEGLAQARSLQARFLNLPSAYQGLASLWVERAEFERSHGLDPRAAVTHSLEALDAAEAKGLRLNNPGFTAGDAHLILGQYLQAVGLPFEAELQASSRSYRTALHDNPNLLAALSGVAEAQLSIAQGQLEDGTDPSRAFEEARSCLDQEGQRGNEPQHAEYLQGVLALLEGRWRKAQGQDPMPAWNHAEGHFRKATRMADLAMGWVGCAEARALAFRHSGRFQDRVQALAAARRALQCDPLRATAWLQMAAVAQEAVRRGDAGAAPQAHEAWERALTLDGNLRRTARSLGMP
jgi:hypothetical protein